MKAKRKIKHFVKRIMSVTLGAVMMISMLPATSMKVQAASQTVFDRSKTADQLVASLLGSGITATNITSSGSVQRFSSGSSELGIETGIALDTSDNGAIDIDPDLLTMIENNGNSYGGNGHASTIQFDLTATGTLLNFNYAFASCEFDQDASYNDAFGLFVSVNGGAFENIALLDNGKPVTIQNLKNGEGQADYTGSKYYTCRKNS